MTLEDQTVSVLTAAAEIVNAYGAALRFPATLRHAGCRNFGTRMWRRFMRCCEDYWLDRAIRR